MVEKQAQVTFAPFFTPPVNRELTVAKIAILPKKLKDNDPFILVSKGKEHLPGEAWWYHIQNTNVRKTPLTEQTLYDGTGHPP